MTDYVNTFGAATKDATTAIIAAVDIGSELDNIATAVGTKADKAVPTSIGNIAVLTSSGNLSDGGKGVPTGTIVGTSDTQTLTNKTLTSPTINTPDINGGTWNGTIDGDVVVGGATLSTTEISYLDGVSGNIQTQINSSNATQYGVSQTFQDVTASRVSGTPYTNSTGRPIWVYIRATATIPGVTARTSVVVGPVTIYSDLIVPTGAEQVTLSFPVPNGISYTLSVSNCSKTSWIELR